MLKDILLTATLVLGASSLFAQQFSISAEIRPRFENRHGYKTLSENNLEGSNFISQRSRLNFKFQEEKIRLGVTLQNVRVWGDVSTLASDDAATALHEAWAQAILSDQVSLKMGRQEIVYDDHRIFGNVGWAQQARSHDALLFKFTPNPKNKLDIGLALNSDAQNNFDELYSNAAGYKNLQYLWYHGDFDKLGLSILALNTGVEFLNAQHEQTVNYTMTFGPRLTYKSGDFSANAAAYIQKGKTRNMAINTSYFSGNIAYQIAPNVGIGLGMEYLSGKDMNDSESTIKSFTPLFGTNHKFNGWMDYFYVGNHGGSVGLIDYNAALTVKKDKFSAKVIPHLFYSAAEVHNASGKMDNSLGTEIDFSLSYAISKDINLNAGFSKMLATETLEALKGGDKEANSSWAWLMLTFKPTLFSHSSSK